MCWLRLILISLGLMVPLIAKLPTPPQQGKSWEAPVDSRLPDNWVRAIGDVIACGLADPRGCAYREIDITFHYPSLRGGQGADVLTTHGWVLPIGPNDAQRHAICWNGLVYQVTRVGEPMAVAPDVWAMMASAPRVWRQQAPAESESVQRERCYPMRICLLLLLGEDKLAGNLWSIWKVLLERQYERHRDDPFLFLARDWLWNGVHSGTQAHRCSDDVLARSRLNSVIAAGEKVRPLLQAHGVEPSKHYDPLRFLEVAAQLAADQKRRQKTPESKATSWRGLTPDEFVRQLENSTPDPKWLLHSALHSAALGMGDKLVRPLINCLEEDDRLTRMVSYGERGPHLSVYPVSGLAYQMLTQVLKTQQFCTSEEYFNPWTTDPDIRRAKADEIRRFWKLHEGSSAEVRCYDILRADNAGPLQWLAASKELVRMEGAFSTTVSDDGSVSMSPNEPGMRGELLRTRTDPSVDELFSTRVAQLNLSEDQPVTKAALLATEQACELALFFHAWDPEAAAPTLASQIDHGLRTWKRCDPRLRRSRSRSRSRLPDLLSRLANLLEAPLDESVFVP